MTNTKETHTILIFSDTTSVLHCTGAIDRVVNPGQKNQLPGQIKELGNGFAIRAPGQNLVPAQPKIRAKTQAFKNWSLPPSQKNIWWRTLTTAKTFASMKKYASYSKDYLHVAKDMQQIPHNVPHIYFLHSEATSQPAYFIITSYIVYGMQSRHMSNSPLTRCKNLSPQIENEQDFSRLQPRVKMQTKSLLDAGSSWL
jgi:hypothetical protein